MKIFKPTLAEVIKSSELAAAGEGRILSRRDTPGDTQPGTSKQELGVALMAALFSGPIGSYRTLNADAPHGLPPQLANPGIQPLSQLFSGQAFTFTELREATDGTAATATVTFDLQTAGEVAMSLLMGLHIEVSYQGDTGTQILGVQVSYTTPYGARVLNTELRSISHHDQTELTLLFHDVHDGEFIYCPALLGHWPVMDATPEPAFPAAPYEVEVAITNALNKEVIITGLNARSGKSLELISQIVLAE